MPYSSGDRLPAEFASKLGHVDFIENEFIKKLVGDFDKSDTIDIKDKTKWETIPVSDSLDFIYAVDGSLQPIISDRWPFKKLAAVKVALVKIDRIALSKIDQDNPHPNIMQDLMSDSSVFHGNFIPLQHIRYPDMTTYDTIREVIFAGFKEPKHDNHIMETLKWLAYTKWTKGRPLPVFICPHCNENKATLPFDEEKGNCPNCGKEIYVTDWLGFHQNVGEDSAQESIANDYMAIYETIMLFTCIRYMWENFPERLSKCLFIKDGPLSIRAQYSKLVEPIRNFLEFALSKNITIYLMGQEKTGQFVDHLQLIIRDVESMKMFIPEDKYIKEEVKQVPLGGQMYGKDTNYGSKIFVKINNFHSMVLNIPKWKKDGKPIKQDLIGIEKIFGTLSTLLSSKHESALVPVEMANNIASLSTYPSAKLLKLLAEEAKLI